MVCLRSNQLQQVNKEIIVYFQYPLLVIYHHVKMHIVKPGFTIIKLMSH